MCEGSPSSVPSLHLLDSIHGPIYLNCLMFKRQSLLKAFSGFPRYGYINASSLVLSASTHDISHTYSLQPPLPALSPWPPPMIQHIIIPPEDFWVN